MTFRGRINIRYSYFHCCGRDNFDVVVRVLPGMHSPSFDYNGYCLIVIGYCFFLVTA